MIMLRGNFIFGRAYTMIRILAPSYVLFFFRTNTFALLAPRFIFSSKFSLVMV